MRISDNYGFYVSEPSLKHSAFLHRYNVLKNEHKLYNLSSGKPELLAKGILQTKLNPDCQMFTIHNPLKKEIIITANLNDSSIDTQTWLELVNISLSDRKKKLTALLLEKKGLIPGTVLPKA